MSSDKYVHDLSDVLTDKIGVGTRIWQYVVVLPGAVIGADCNVCAHCFIENDVVIGDRVTVKNGVQLWDGLQLGNDVFVGPNVTFTNDRFPRSLKHQDKPLSTIVESGASLGAGAVVLPGLVIGQNAMVGSGAVVTRSVPANAIVVGNPARIVGYVDANLEVVVIDSDHPPTEVKGPAVEGVELIEMPRITDTRGTLSVGEFERSVPFEAKRYFMVFDVPSVETRGEHAHRECDQFMICVRGSVSIVADDGKNRQEFVLDRPDRGLHLSPMVWGIQYKYSADALLLVFASHFYDADDYIRNYKDFLKEKGLSLT